LRPRRSLKISENDRGAAAGTLAARPFLKIEAGRHGRPAERLHDDSGTTMARVHDDISYNTPPGSSTSSGGSWARVRAV